MVLESNLLVTQSFTSQHGPQVYEDADVSTGFTKLGGSGHFDIIVPAETHRQHINDHMLYYALINYHHTHSITADP